MSVALKSSHRSERGTNRRRSCALISAGLSICAGSRAAAQCDYTISAIIQADVDCGILGPVITQAVAINDHGVVTGTYNCIAGAKKPFMWSQETGFIAIPLPPGMTFAVPNDVNNNNEIVGQMGNGGPARAFHYADGVWTDLGVLPGAIHMDAHAISDAGVIVGDGTGSLVGSIAFRWSEGVLLPLDLPLGPDASADDINIDAVVTGWMGDSFNTVSSAFIWQGGASEAIPDLRNATSARGVALNRSESVAGDSSVNELIRSWLYRDGVLTDLGVPEGFQHVFVRGMNDADQVLLRSTINAISGAFLWQNGSLGEDIVAPLESLPSFFINRQLHGPNNLGQLAGRGGIVTNGVSTTVGLVFSPVVRLLGDVTLDCVVDEYDLMEVLGDWGPTGEREGILADIVTSETFQPPGDGRVDAADLAVVLGNWSIVTSRPK